MEIISRQVTIRHRGVPVTHPVELVRLPDGRWSSDALFALRYGRGETIYRRALVLPTYPVALSIEVSARDFSPFRELDPELLGWVHRLATGIRGFESSSAPENNDRDEVTLARLVGTHGRVVPAVPDPPYDYDEGPSRFVRVGDRCVICGVDTSRNPATIARRQKTEITSTLSRWYPEEERDAGTNLVGWSCAPCGQTEPCACPVCPDCDKAPDEPAGGELCASCAIACPPHFIPASSSSVPRAYAPLSGISLHGSLEDRAGTDRLLAIDARLLPDRLLAGSTRIECEAYVLLESGQVEAIAVLWRRGPNEVRGLVVDSSDEAAIEYAEARAAERSDSL